MTGPLRFGIIPPMREFEPLTLLSCGDSVLQVYGAEWDTRSDETSSLMVAQAYAVNNDCEEGSLFVHEDGTMWRLTKGIPEGFYVDGIVLEEEHSATE